MFTFIDDYIIVSFKKEASKSFDQLSELLDELSLPMNPDKRTPLVKLGTARKLILILLRIF